MGKLEMERNAEFLRSIRRILIIIEKMFNSFNFVFINLDIYKDFYIEKSEKTEANKTYSLL